MKIWRSVLLVILLPTALHAHEGERLRPHDLWSAWRFDPVAVVALLLAAYLYGRGARCSRGVRHNEMIYFWAGWIALALALVSPLHPLGETLFSAHMIQHEILILVSAPFLVLSRPLTAMLWGMPLGWRRELGQWAKGRPVQFVWRKLTGPLAAWWIHAVALWVWHAPMLFQATLENEWLHAFQHLSFFLSALLFWWALFSDRTAHSYGSAVLYIFTTAIHTSILGALLTFSPKVWYPTYATSTWDWGLSPLEDQQMGGLIMWVPAGIIYIVAGLFLFSAWLRQSDVMADRSSYAD